MSDTGLDEQFLRRSFDVARRSMTHGNHPFGAILVDGDGKVLLEVENGLLGLLVIAAEASGWPDWWRRASSTEKEKSRP